MSICCIMDQDKRCLTESALRVYLIRKVLETEEILEKYKLRQRLLTHQLDTIDWKKVTAAATTLLTFTQNCLHDLEHYGLSGRIAYGLCAVDAGTDVLLDFFSRPEMPRFALQEVGIYRRVLSQQLIIRSKCLVNAIAALHDGDSEVTELWDRAARHIHKQNPRRHVDIYAAVNWLDKCLPDLSSMSSAAGLSKAAEKEIAPEIEQVQSRAARNYRRFAAFEVLDRKTNFKHVATVYEAAIEYYMQARQCTTLAAELWRLAANKMRSAAEFLEARAMESAHQGSLCVHDVIATADQLAAKAVEVHDLGIDVARLDAARVQAVTFVANCNVPCALPVWQEFIRLHDQIQRLFKEYVNTLITQSAINSTSAAGLLSELTAAKRELVGLSPLSEELKLDIERAEWYRAQAHEYRHLHQQNLRDLWHQCWTGAALEMDAIVQISADMILSATTLPSFLVLQDSTKAQRMKIKMYMSCTRDLITVAAECLNAARGAKVAGHDERRRAWLLSAAEHYTQAATLYLADITTVAIAQLQPLHPPVPAAVNKSMGYARSYADAADCLDKARKVLANEENPLWSVRVAELYNQAADLLVYHVGSSAPYRVTCQKSAILCLDLIDMLRFPRKTDSAEQVALMDRGCKCALQYLNALKKENTPIIAAWYDALQACLDGLRLCADGKNRLSVMSTVHAALYESSAEVLSRGDQRNSTVLRYAAQIVENAIDWRFKRVFASMYQMALAARVCFAHADSNVAPEVLGQVSDKFKNNDVDAILQEHAVWCGTEIERICEARQQDVGEVCGADEADIEQANSDFLLRAEQVVGCVGVVERDYVAHLFFSLV